jgi:hypothetical protein
MSFTQNKQAQQAKKEEYAKTQAADIVRSIITNTSRHKAKTPIVNIDGLTMKQKHELSKLTFEEYDVMSKSVAMRRMMARFLETDEKLLAYISNSAKNVKKQIDSSPITLKEKMRANTSSIKEVAPEFLRELAALKALSGKAKTITIRNLPDDTINLIMKKYKSLLKYNLREWIPHRKIYWGFCSLNPNAIDFLSLPENKKKIDYSQLSKNTNPKALELIKEEIRINPNNPDIDWRALSANPEAIDILDVHRDKIKWYSLCLNTSPRAIQILKENQLEKDNGDDDIYWEDLCLNTSNEAIDFLKENYRYIEWDILSVNTNPKAIALLINKESEEFDLEDREFNRLEDKEKISWRNLSENPNAISLLERKWEEEKELLRNDIKQYNLLKKKDYIIDWDVLSGNPKAIDLLRDKIEEEKKIPKKKFDRLDHNEKINWAKLSASAEPKVIQLLEENPTKIDWGKLSANPKAIKLLEENPTKINWTQLSANSKAIKLLKKELNENPENIGWYQLSKNPEAISILDKNMDKIIWSQFSENPNAGELLKLKDRVEFEGKLPQKKYNQLTNYSKLNWIALSLNPSIFTLS